MLKEVTSLLGPLVLSTGIHLGAIALMDAVYGAAAVGGGSGGRRHAAMQVDLRGGPAGQEVRAGSLTDGGVAAGDSLPAGLLALPGPFYFPAGSLSRKPQAVAPVPLDYPEDAPLVEKSRVVLRLLISESGDVDKVIVETADVPGALEAIARQAFARAKFRPGLRGEVAVKSQMRVEITFEGGNAPPAPGVIQPSR